ncbi:MAG TPA: PQQ-binding-like beta-propeller repeat protein, partial [Xanthomonadales bacterium]|nr:PQQ-binding-like beta-propeller repeat protein [Xanthomonadales bacterium]
MSLRLGLLLLVVAVAGCKKSRKDECKELADMAMALADGMSKSLGDGKSISGDPEIKAKMKEFHDQCMAWPDEVFECMRANDETSPKCVEAMSHVTGVVSTNLDKAPQGPEIVASAELGATDWDGMRTSLATDGTLTAATKTFVTAFASSGKEKWRTPIENEGWMVDLQDGSFLVGSQAHELVAIDGETGDVRWRIAIPVAEEYADRSTEGAVRTGEHALVAIADGRFLRVDPAACAKKKQKGCIEPAFALDDSLYEPKLLALGGGGDVVVGTSNHVRRFKDGKLIASIYVRDDFGGVASLGGTKVAVTMDDELVLWDLAKCPAAPVVLPRKQGRMYMRGEGDCEDCAAPPNGCL